MRYLSLLLPFLLLSFVSRVQLAKSNGKQLVVDNLTDPKDLKKLLRTKTNVLVCFYNSNKKAQNVLSILQEVAKNIKGEGVIATINCSGEAKKICKKYKIPSNESYSVKHYKDGEFNKDYDRRYNEKSMTNFMRDPTGDLPWEEDDAAKDVFHIPDPTVLVKFLKREPKPILIMFYAPWCGYCKSLKPEYAQAATELKDHSVLAAVDVNRAENAVLRTQYNISGFPTLLYFANGSLKFSYEGENKRAALVSFMQNPTEPKEKVQEPEWSEKDNEIVHLTTTNFDTVLKDEASVLIMFYAPWCGHCKKMKPEYEKAASEMKIAGIPGVLAAVDATKEPNIASNYNVKGYPTILYFSYGEKLYDVNVREAQKIVEFMRDPKEPPPPPPPEKHWSEENTEVVHLNDENFKPFLKKKKHVLVMFYAPWCGHCKRAKPEFSGAAEHFKDDPKVEFAAVDCTTQSAVCSAFDVKGYPTIKYFSYYNKETKPYSGGRTTADFVQYMSNPMAIANAPPATPPPQEQWVLDPSVMKLNDKNFKNELKKNGIVLVMFYAPWCGHCKKMKPDYVAAAQQLQSEGYDKCMAIIDCTENPDIAEEYNIQGFPTIKLFKNGKHIADYDGKRSVDDIKRFVRQYYNKKDEL
ncbi:protein disulfide-isomerase A5 [Sitophilus oryzae]|uniref:Protein disulfide-isomerase A5 n=1 Tax=Sitophilus oryzae TaxID=7048 RepID=A0A6J2Y0J7_SITOR|nr:protein disulfide-isomerase A5 [Sitophilus oryzae]